MLVIRLQRVGKKNQAMYRLVLTDKQNGPKSGRFKEILGSYNPHKNEVQFDAEKITHWIGNGAQPSDTVHNLLVKNGIIKGDKKNVLPKKTPQVQTEETTTNPTSSEAGPAGSDNVGEEKTEEASPDVDDKPAETPKEEKSTEEKKEGGTEGSTEETK